LRRPLSCGGPRATAQFAPLPYIRPWVCKPVRLIQPTTICRVGSEMCTGKRQLNFCLAGNVNCLERGADLHMAQLMPLPLIVTCFSKIQIGSTFLVAAQPGSPGQRTVKRACVCCVYTFSCITSKTQHRCRVPIIKTNSLANW